MFKQDDQSTIIVNNTKNGISVRQIDGRTDQKVHLLDEKEKGQTIMLRKGLMIKHVLVLQTSKRMQTRKIYTLFKFLLV